MPVDQGKSMAGVIAADLIRMQSEMVASWIASAALPARAPRPPWREWGLGGALFGLGHHIY